MTRSTAGPTEAGRIVEYGRVVSVHLAPVAGAPTYSVAQARAVAGRGLASDRNYWAGDGPRRPGRGSGRASGVCDVTLIEIEALEALARETAIELSPAQCRRNVVCQGIRLNPLVGTEFRVGGVTLRGLRLSEPCVRLEQLTRPGLVRGLLHRGGLRAEIVHGGPIHVGDPVGHGGDLTVRAPTNPPAPLRRPPRTEEHRP
ncbi:MOSC domain-containing protein [Streptomyces sp. NPDC047515]|uniref:MOSC domain-containing protein n=1 Tax=Streptomyces sp. NPDC047515 TaxID=3155380 RepID=UPI0033DCF303